MTPRAAPFWPAHLMLRNLLLAAESFVTLAWMRALVRFAPARAFRGALDETPSVRPVDAEVIRIFQRVAARTPVAHTCIHRSLALQRLLARRGSSATLRIGIGRRPNLFPGHAWLEADGTVIGDDAAQVARYVPLTISESALCTTWRS